MFYPYTFAYKIGFDATRYIGIVWPFAEVMGTLAATVVGLLSVWLGTGRAHWFLRTVPILGLIWLTTLLSAYDLGVIVGLQCIVVSVPLSRARMRGSQFGVADLLLCIVVFTVGISFLVRVPGEIWKQWQAILWFGLGFGLLTLIAVAIASQHQKLGWRWLIVIVFPYIALMVTWLRLERRWLDEHGRRALLALICLSLLVVSPVLMAFLLLVHRAPIPVVTPPAENCLPTLCELGDSLPETLFRPFPTTRATLATVVSQCAPAIRGARDVMHMPGWVEVNYDVQDAGNFKNRAPQRDPLVQLKDAFLAEGDLAAAEGRLEDALTSYRDIVRLAHCAGYGGLPFDTSLAAEFEAQGMIRVHALVKSMTVTQCKTWIEALSIQESAFESAELLRQRRHAWVDRIASWNDRLVLWYLQHLDIDHTELRLDVYERLRPTRIRMLMTELALQSYRLEHGKYPRRLDELVMDYVSTTPIDPFSGRTLVYRPADGGYSLYSVGRDGIDDGGMLPPDPYWFHPGDFTVAILQRL